MNIIQEFMTAKTIDEDFIRKLVTTYGKRKINQFLENHLTIFTTELALSKEDRITTLRKVRDFIHLYGNKMSSINYYKLLGAQSQTRKRNQSDSGKEISSYEAYIQKIRQYQLLTPAEEIQVGWDLLLKDKINIMLDSKAKTLNMKMVLLSISTEEERKQVFNLLEKFYHGSDFIDRDEAEMIKQDIKTYNRLCKKLGRIPSKQELKEYFDGTQKESMLDFNDIGESLPFSELIDQIQKFTTYRKARMTMLYCNLRLVVKIANQYANGNNIEDLISEGNRALLEAINRYDVTYGTKFSTYASYWIKQYIIRYIQQNRVPRIPENKMTKIIRIKQKEKELEAKGLGQISISMLSEETGISYEEISSLLKYSQSSISLDAPIIEGENKSLLDTLIGEEGITSPLEKEEQRQEIRKLLSYLSPRYEEIMLMRFGINAEDEEPMTLSAIGEKYGITKERVRQIESTSLKKLRLILGVPIDVETASIKQLKK